jgi:hypothetical protein
LKLSVFSSAGNLPKSNGQAFSDAGCGCTPKTCGCH